MPDFSVSAGFDYAAFAQSAKSASGMVQAQMLKDFGKMSQDIAGIFGEKLSAARPIRASTAFTAAMTSPVSAPVKAIGALAALSFLNTRRAAAATGRAVAREFNLAPIWDRNRAKLAGMFAPLQVPLHQAWGKAMNPTPAATNAFRRPFIKAANWLENTFPKSWNKVMNPGPAAFNLIRRPVIRAALAMENTFPNAWQRAMKKAPGFDQWMTKGGSGKMFPGFQRWLAQGSAGSGFTGKLMRGIQFTAAMIPSLLGGAFRILGSIIGGVWSIGKTMFMGILNVVTSVTKSVLLLGVGIGSLLAYGISQATQRIKELNAVSRETGFRAADIYLLDKALFRTGLGAREVAGIMAQMRESQFFGVGPTLLQQLGINLQEFGKKSPIAQFEELAATINAIQNPIMRAEIATKLLGEAGARAVANFQKGDVSLAQRMFGGTAAEIDKTQAAIAMAHDRWAQMKESVGAFFDRITAKLGPILEKLSAWFADVLIPKAQQWADSIGSMLANVLNVLIGAVSLGKVGTLLKLSFEMAVYWLADKLAQAFRFAGSLLQSLWQDPNFASGLYLAISGIKDVLIWAFQAAAPVLAKIMGAAVGGAMALINPIGKAQWMADKSGQANDAAKQYANTKALLDQAVQAGDVEAMKRLSAKAYEQGQQTDRLVMQANDPMGYAKEQAENFGNSFSQSAAELFGTPSTNIIETTSAKFAKAIGKLSKTVVDIQKLWDVSAKDSLTPPELKAEFDKIIAELKAEGQRLTSTSGAGPAPGDPGNDGKGGRLGYIQTQFDQWRRIGAGLSSTLGTTSTAVSNWISAKAITSAMASKFQTNPSGRMSGQLDMSNRMGLLVTPGMAARHGAAHFAANMRAGQANGNAGFFNQLQQNAGNLITRFDREERRLQLQEESRDLLAKIAENTTKPDGAAPAAPALMGAR